MVAGSTMDPESVGLVRDYVTELMTCVKWLSFYSDGMNPDRFHRYMVNERHRIFQKEYDSASLQYQNISRS